MVPFLTNFVRSIDVDEAEKIVYIRAIRRKTPEQTTEDIVQ
jgi:hypothetical protein